MLERREVKMRSYLRAFTVASAMLLGPSCADAQFQAQPARPLGLAELHSAVKAMRLVKVSGGEGTQAYFDVLTEGVCDSAVAAVARAWVQQWGLATAFNRVLVLNAVVEYPDDRGTKTIPLLVDSNIPGDYRPMCQPIVALAIPRYKRVHITIELLATTGIGDKTALAVANLLPGVTGIMGKLGIWGKVAAGAAAGLAAVAPDADSLKKLLKQGQPSASDQIDFGVHLERVNFVLGEQPIFSLKPEPRPQLLGYGPGQPAYMIPEAINTVSAKSWDEIVNDATAGRQWWTTARSLGRFCVSLRDRLGKALQHDPLAVNLGLYYHSVSHPGEYENLGRINCLSSQELENLKRQGYTPVF
jgi:hypothetical protein